ncbi:ankyrin repeat domain-containing protein [Verrucomicrobiaceae bacterium E54]|nr:ankyrin repeat domain-containing protein [Verrucomicrobiaceae bacterium E54]
MIALLLKTKIDPTLKSKQGVTALDLAKKFENAEAIEMLSE